MDSISEFLESPAEEITDSVITNLQAFSATSIQGNSGCDILINTW